MKKNLYDFLKNIENLEIKNLRDLNNLRAKSLKFKEKIKKKPETIENRLKINILEKIIEGIDQEQFIFLVSDKNGTRK